MSRWRRSYRQIAAACEGLPDEALLAVGAIVGINRLPRRHHRDVGALARKERLADVDCTKLGSLLGSSSKKAGSRFG